MGRHVRMKEAALALGIAFSLAQQISGAAAFSTEPSAPQQNNKQSAPLSPFGQQLSLPGETPPANPGDPLTAFAKQPGTEITIPGIGSVGTLPKLDFGLELLYGPKSTPDDALQLDQQVPQQQHGPDSNDVQIKGTLTHKF